MKTSVLSPKLTFAVHDVEPGTEPLEVCKTHDALATLIGQQVESCCDYTTNCVKDVSTHPLITTVYGSFRAHRPLILSPDMIWLTILQGFAQHIKNDPERYRERFVSHSGQRIIEVARNNFVLSSPENPWDEVIHAFSTLVMKDIGEKYQWIIPDFSTTGINEKLAAEVTLLDAMQPYYEYRFYCICGIPTVTLEGSVDDWQRLANKVNRLNGYDLDWWLEHLRPICQQFIVASQGSIDLDHWRNIYQTLDGYGGPYANGWILKLIPYLKNRMTGNFTEVNSLLKKPFAPYPPTPSVPDPNSPKVWKTEGGCVDEKSLPSGISRAPFHLVMPNGHERSMEFLGGFVGITQDPETLALRPKIGWAVRSGSQFDQLLLQLRKHEIGKKPSPIELNQSIEQFEERFHRFELPGDFLSFYKATEWANLCRISDRKWIYRILALENLIAINPSYPTDDEKLTHRGRYTPSFRWLRFVELPDGTSLALNFDCKYAKAGPVLEKEEAWIMQRSRDIWMVIHCRENQSDPRQAYRVIAWSFGEFLHRALASKDRPYFEEPDFVDRGDPFSEPQFFGTSMEEWNAFQVKELFADPIL